MNNNQSCHDNFGFFFFIEKTVCFRIRLMDLRVLLLPFSLWHKTLAFIQHDLRCAHGAPYAKWPSWDDRHVSYWYSGQSDRNLDIPIPHILSLIHLFSEKPKYASGTT